VLLETRFGDDIPDLYECIKELNSSYCTVKCETVDGLKIIIVQYYLRTVHSWMCHVPKVLAVLLISMSDTVVVASITISYWTYCTVHVLGVSPITNVVM